MKKKKLIILTTVILILIFSGSGLVKLITDWFWFQQLGLANIFTTILGAKLLVGVVAALITFGILYLNLIIASRITKGRAVHVKVNEQGSTVDISKHLNKLNLYISALLGVFTGLAMSVNWQTVLKYFNAVSFNSVDPILGRDISFYFFSLPFLETLANFLLWTLVLSLIGITLIYAGRKAVKKRKQLNYDVEDSPKKHIFLILGIIFLIMAVKTYFVKISHLLYSTNGPFTGASYVDIHANLPVLKLMTFILVIGAIACILNLFWKKSHFVWGAVIIYLGVSVLGGWLYPLIMDKFLVKPNELVKESPYIVHNIGATQQAFGLDKIEEYELSGETQLTTEDIENNQTTIKNIRLWDRDPLLDTFGQVQEIRTYYDFVSVDNDRYYINDEYRQVLLSARELNPKNLPHRTFINEHLTFTHGFGLTLGPVNEVSKEGLPVLFIKDLPPISTIESLQVTRPEIYYGELTNDYVFVNTGTEEFDYPSGEENVYTNYQGEGGVPIGSVITKALFAIRFGELKVFLSEDINSQSRVMYYRNIRQRIKKVLPFLKLDQDPYLVITDQGQLKWICDAYTTSNLYPYSQRIGSSLDTRINYIRNSVKVIVDAYSGDMQLYIADPQDPIIKTYANIFKNTFLSLDEMPSDLRAHLRYPEDYFNYQSTVYSVYHMGKPQIFYNKEDQWEIPVISEGAGDPMMRHIIMKLPNEEKEEYILMIPFTPQKKDNLAAWMVARSDRENYGKLAIYKFPKQRLVFGPSQIINRINQSPEISRQISLWDQRGSEVNQGPLLVIPIEESLLYVRPLYLRAQGGKIPELKRVIVAYENQIVMGETLDIALSQLFSGLEASPQQKDDSVDGKIIQPDLIKQAKQYFDRAMEAQQVGNWASYGEEMKKLEQILEKLLK